VSSFRRLRLGMVGGGQGAFIGGVHRIAARIDDRYELSLRRCPLIPRVRRERCRYRLPSERSYADFREMARREAEREDGIEVVAIVTPNHLHAPVATAFLDAGIHVICDKPLAMSVAEGRALAALARSKQRVFTVTLHIFRLPMVRHARALVRAGELGEIRLIQAEYQAGLACAAAGARRQQAGVLAHRSGKIGSPRGASAISARMRISWPRLSPVCGRYNSRPSSYLRAESPTR